MSKYAAGLPDWIKAHIELYLKDPDKGHLWDAGQAGGSGLLPTLLLTTTGRQSGEPRLLPLIYRKVRDDYIVIASKGGHAKHPSWYLNLEAAPDCQIQVGRDKYEARMRVASDSERDDLWSKMVAIYPPYDAYKVAAGDRVIPVVVLQPKT